MRVTMTSAAARIGHANEDFTGAVPTAAVLIDVYQGIITFAQLGKAKPGLCIGYRSKPTVELPRL